MTNPASLADQLWHFALAKYQQAAVMQTCLTLQDQYHAHVNIILWALWLEERGILLTSERLAQARATTDAWHSAAIQPLRKVRRQIKLQFLTRRENEDSAYAESYRQAKAAELAAEKVELGQLEQLAQAWKQDSSSVKPGDNLLLYFQDLGLTDPAHRRLLFALTNRSGS